MRPGPRGFPQNEFRLCCDDPLDPHPHPERVMDVSRRLGHKSVNATHSSYLGTEDPAASRRINALLAGICGVPEESGP